MIPAGRLMMGNHISPVEVASKYGSNADCYKWEHPQHEVRINKEFYLPSTQVTQAQWKKMMGDNPSRFKKMQDDCPVETVSWDEAQNLLKSSRKLRKPINTAYRQRLSGNMPAVREPAKIFPLVTIPTNWTNMLDIQKILKNEFIRLEQSNPMPGVFTICTATSGNG